MTDLWSTLMTDLSEWGGLDAVASQEAAGEPTTPTITAEAKEPGPSARPAATPLTLVPAPEPVTSNGRTDNEDSGPVDPVLPHIPAICAYPYMTAVRPDAAWVVHGVIPPDAVWWADEEIVIPDFGFSLGSRLSIVRGNGNLPATADMIGSGSFLSWSSELRSALAQAPVSRLQAHRGYMGTLDHFDPCYRDVEVTAWSKVRSWGTTHRVAEHPEIGRWTLRVQECGRVAAAYPIASQRLLAA